MQLLATGCAIGEEGMRLRIELCASLQRVFRYYLPNCLLVPFGSIVSGHASVTSDLDLVLLTNPSAKMRELFSGPEYLPGLFFSSHEGEMDGESPKQSFPTLISTPSVPLSSLNCVTEFKLVNSVIRSIPEFVRVLCLPHARCPVVRFQHSTTGIHCDISLDNL